MAMGRVIAGLGAGALVAAAFAVAPATGAPSDAPAAKRPVPLSLRAGIGSFTPADADPRLAAAMARAGLGATGFRFTPTETRRSGARAVTVAVRSRVARPEQAAAGNAASVGLTPIGYSLGAAVGWKRFALSGDVAKLDMAGLPGSRELADIGVTYTGRRASARISAGADRPLADTPRMIAGAEAYSLDMGGSYSLTRNLDVTAGVRYRSDRDRLERLRDERRDSQAVYVGTAFRF